jgi:3-hydroxyacyl-[acyl-carrier-protein] dehydratase
MDVSLTRPEEVLDTLRVGRTDIREILKHIPHRYPFLLIDYMEECEPKKWVRVVKNVSANDAYFVGSHPFGRAMPQVLVVEALAQAAGVLCHFSGMMGGTGKSLIFFAGIEKCTFQRDVHAGERLVLECSLRRSLRGVAILSGAARVGGDPVVDASLSAVVRSMD